MAITFCDVPLLLEDPGHRFGNWLKRNLPLEDLRLWGGEPVAYREGRHEARSQAIARTGLLTYNWPDGPRWKLNSLWWPSGAARWAHGLFLADEPGLQEILEALGEDGSGTLKLYQNAPDRDELNIEGPHVEAEMILLTPRQLNYSDTSWSLNGWLLPLVDRRYLWQWRDTGSLVMHEDMTWEDVVDEIAAELSEDVQYTAIDVVGPPNVTELTRQYENAALLLDAVAATVGQRVVRLFNGEVWLQDPSDALAIHRGNVEWMTTSDDSEEGGADELTAYRLAGGPTHADYWGPRPSQVRVVFPRCVRNVPQNDGDVFVVTIGASTFDAADPLHRWRSDPGTARVFFDSAPADFTDQPTMPANLDWLTTLAGEIAQSYFAWLAESPYDATYLGLRTWTPTGFDDYVWFHCGHQHAAAIATTDEEENAGDYAFYTRIASLPPAVGVSELLHGRQDRGSSSSGYNSSSSGDDEGPNCDVVTDVFCNDDGSLQVCTRNIIFPPGTIIGDEDCAYSSSQEFSSFSASSASSASSESSYSSSSNLASVLVTGTMTPDVTGTYLYAGSLNGRSYYARVGDTVDAQWIIWFDSSPDEGHWVISTVTSDLGPEESWFEGAHPEIEGRYNSAGNAVGWAIVAASE